MNRIAMAAVLAAMIAVGCTRAPDHSNVDLSKRRIKIVATTGMVADLAREIGGDRVDVSALMGPGVDPHLYKATAGDIDRLADADLILYNGLHLEGKMAEVLESYAEEHAVVAVTDPLDRARLLSAPGLADYHDPHVWFDVALWAGTTKAVADILVELDPKSEAGYRQREVRYREQLEALDAETRAAISTIPKARRVLVTSHDAFRYFGRAYDIEVTGLQGISTVVEAGLSDRERVVNLVVSRGIKALFVETSVSRKSIDAVLHDVRLRGHDATIGGALFSDAMGGEPPKDTYIGMVRANVSTLVNALK